MRRKRKDRRSSIYSRVSFSEKVTRAVMEERKDRRSGIYSHVSFSEKGPNEMGA